MQTPNKMYVYMNIYVYIFLPNLFIYRSYLQMKKLP